MITQLYAIHDSKSGAFMSPYAVQNDLMALRAFHQAILVPNTMPHDFPGDYILFRIARFDDETGEIIPEIPFNLGSGTQFSPAASRVLNTGENNG